MNIRKFELSDFEELVSMYYALTKEIYLGRTIGEKYFFYKAVGQWIMNNNDIIVSHNDKELTGFTMAFIDGCGGITNPIYNGEIAYVKPEYRKSRAAYMLYMNVSNYAIEQGLTLIANAYIGGGDKVDQIQKKLGGEPKFISMERGI